LDCADGERLSLNDDDDAASRVRAPGDCADAVRVLRVLLCAEYGDVG
jgi:hypothetical protein